LLWSWDDDLRVVFSLLPAAVAADRSLSSCRGRSVSRRPPSRLLDATRSMSVPAVVSLRDARACLGGSLLRGGQIGWVCTVDEQADVMRDGRGRPVCVLGTIDP